MKNPDYQKPIVRVVKTKNIPMLASTYQSLQFNPNDGTTDALSRRSDSQEWDDGE